MSKSNRKWLPYQGSASPGFWHWTGHYRCADSASIANAGRALGANAVHDAVAFAVRSLPEFAQVAKLRVAKASAQSHLAAAESQLADVRQKRLRIEQEASDSMGAELVQVDGLLSAARDSVKQAAAAVGATDAILQGAIEAAKSAAIRQGSPVASQTRARLSRELQDKQAAVLQEIGARAGDLLDQHAECAAALEHLGECGVDGIVRAVVEDAMRQSSETEAVAA